MTLAIETAGLRKSFGETLAVDGIDLQIPRGTVFGLLGPNGAGKTTMIRMLATLLRPDAGTATILGHDVVRDAAAVRAKVSLTGQYASIDEELTGRENLVLVGRLLGFSWRNAGERADELLDSFGLAEAARRQVRTYSGGMKRRLDVAASLVVTPEVLFQMSRRRASTRVAGTRSGPSSVPSLPRERPCSSPHSIWTRQTVWRIGSP
ncbi:ATP-binding cassette domain-containing protein [Haladaptatus pallidirubidus]|uniref:ATP-binding cassette domain-containing protein n=1 Tax=Haladaptatus pallidirubidus TaxID=1008152 RepID=UPI0035ED6F46